MNPIEKRLSALEGGGGEESRIVHAATEEAAERHWEGNRARRGPSHLYLVTGRADGPQITVGEPVKAMMKDVAENGRRITDKQPTPISAQRVWHPSRAQDRPR